VKVILLQDVKGTGKKGQIVEVSDGHAVNFLLPKKLAAEATKGNVAELDAKQKQADHKIKREMDNAQKLADQLKETTVCIKMRVGEGGRMFGSVSNKEIAEALQQQADIAVDKKKIVLAEPVKVIGRHTAQVKLHANVAATVTFDVVAAE
jgi:large subunit ribosomal protein L9